MLGVGVPRLARDRVSEGAARSASWFERYAERFDTVELNTTFYRLPPVSTVEHWAAQAPPGFVYALKLGQFGSHRMKLRDAATWLPNHLDRADRLGPALGADVGAAPAALAARIRSGSTSSSRSRRARCAGRSKCATRRGCTTTCSRCSNVTMPRCASTTCSSTTRGSAPPTGPTCGSTARTRCTRSTSVATAVAGCGAPPTGWRRGPSRASTRTCYFNNDFHGAAVADAEWFRARVTPDARLGVAAAGATTRSAG